MYYTNVLSDEDRAWMKALNGELWPPRDERSEGQKFADRFKAELEPGWKPDLPPKPREQVTREELYRALDLIEPAQLVVSLYCSGMFGGVGISIYEHEQFFGTGAEHLLSISEQHLPRLLDRTVYEHMMGVEAREQKKTPGDVRDDAWELFTKYAFTPKNMEWCKRYKIELRTDRVSYCY